MKTYYFALIALTLIANPYAHAQIPKLPDQLEGALDANPETSAGLFMLSLYNKGLAGGTSGVCLDFSKRDGKSEIKIGLNASAFEVGKSTLQNEKESVTRMKALLHSLSVAQGSPIDATVEGFADGIVYRRGETKNKELAEARANTIAGLFKNDSQVSIQSTDGLSSPGLEKAYVAKQGGDCSKRRKVVINIAAKESKVQVEANGKFQFTPAAFSNRLGADSRKIADQAIENSFDKLQGSLNKPGVTELAKSEAIYEQLKTTGKISKACDQFPLKQLTLAYIHSSIGGTSFSYDDGFGVKKGATGSYYVEDPTTHQKLDLLTLNDSGSPTLLFACFKSDDSWDKALTKFNAESGNSTFMSGKDLLNATGKNNFSDQGTIQVGFDPELMKEEAVADDPRVVASKKSPRVGKNLRGFFCKQCGHGFFFEETKDAGGTKTFHPVYDDRMVRASLTTKTDPLADALNQLSAEDPLALGASLKPQIFVIKNCSGCACKPLDAIRAKNANVVKIDPLAEGAKGNYEASISKKDMDQACVIRPPVWHTCGAAPNEVKSAKFDDFKGSLKYMDPVDGAQYAVDDLKQLVDKLNVGCMSQVKSPQDKIKSVACSGSPTSELPSQDELADCPLVKTQAAK